MSDRDLTHLDIRMQVLCRKFIDQCNADPVFVAGRATVFIDQTYRCARDQNADYEQGRTTPGDIITKARFGDSPHNEMTADGAPASKAFDFAIETADAGLDWKASDPLWQRAIAIGEALGLVSGSHWHCPSDSPHFELKDWKNI